MTVSDVPSVEWRRPNGESATGTAVSGSGSLYISQLVLNLTLFDGGDYTCTATYSLGGQTSPSGTGTHRISVKRKLVNIVQFKIIQLYKSNYFIWVGSITASMHLSIMRSILILHIIIVKKEQHFF